MKPTSELSNHPGLRLLVEWSDRHRDSMKRYTRPTIRVARYHPAAAPKDHQTRARERLKVVAGDEVKSGGRVNPSNRRSEAQIADFWYSCKMHQWAREGRLTADGTLRVNAPERRLSAPDVKRAFPHISSSDAAEIAALLVRKPPQNGVAS